MDNKQENQKIKTNLQGIRGYAILLIFISHCNFGLNPAGVNYTSWFGGLGVSLFIFLSGYLLMENHWNRPIILKAYLKKKLFKFYPLHIVTLIMALPFSIKALIGFDFKAWLALICNLFLTQAWVPSSTIYFSFNAVAWYLSVTIFFILVSPLILKFWNCQNSIKRVVTILAFLIAIEFAWCALFINMEKAHYIIYVFPLIRCVDFLIGAGVYKIKEYITDNKERVYNTMCIVGMLATIMLLIISLNKNSELFSVCVWTIPCVILLFTASKNTKFITLIFSNRIIKTMGDLSFEFFLIHQLVIRYVAKIAEVIGLHSYIFILLINFVIAILATFVLRTARKKFYALRDAG